MKKYKKLCEVCDINMGQSPDSNSYNTEQKGIPFFQGNADFGELYPYVRMWCNSPKKIVEQGTLLISVRAPIGALNFASEKSCIGRGLAGITARSDIELKYIYYCLKAKRGELNRKGTGSTFKAISKNVLGGIEIEYISLDAQKKCSAILDKLNEVIRKKKKQIEYADELIKSRFIEMFGDPEQNPNGYPIKDFDEISVLVTDGEHATPHRTEKGIYLLSARNILNHALQLDDVDYIDEDEYARIAQRVVPQAGDVLISCSGSIGRCCVVPDGLQFQMVRSVALIRFDNTINPIFAEWLITSDELQRQIALSATQSSQANLFQGKIRKLHGYVPPMEFQQEFVAFVEQTNKSKLTIQKSLDELETLNKALMQKYFGGNGV